MYNYYDYREMFSPDEIIVYLRKSRTDDPTLTVEEVLAKHETILNEWVDRNLSSPIPENNRFREIVSGETISDRPEIQKVLKLIESPKIKAILIVEVQRLSRGDLEDAGRLIKLLRYTNTLVITPTKTYDLIDEYDRDAFERELKRGNEFLEYQKKIMGRGRLLSVSQGNFIGSIPPYGYDKALVTEGRRKCPVLVINEEQAEVVRMIFDMYVHQNKGCNYICHRLDSLHITPPKGQHWSPAAIKDMLANVHYIGKVKWNWRKTVTIVEDSEIIKTRPKSKDGDYLIYDGKHQPIISDELFQLAQDKRGRNHRAKVTTKVRNPLAGLLYCECGRAMSLRYYKRPDGTEKSSPRLICDGQVHCDNGSYLYSEMIDFVITVLKQKISEYEIEASQDNDATIKSHTKLIKSLEKKLSDLQDRELSQWEAQSDPDMSKRMPQHIFQQLNAKLLAEKEEVERALQRAYDELPTPIDYEKSIITLQTALNALLDDEVSAEQKNKFLKACIDRITYRRERPKKIGRFGWSDTPANIDVKLNV